MKPLLPLIALLLIAPMADASKSKSDDYRLARLDEAFMQCHDAVMASAKDPTSITFDPTYDYGLGRVLTKNDVFIYVKTWGRNSYGAVLRHSVTCTVECKKDKPCKIADVQDDPA